MSEEQSPAQQESTGKSYRLKSQIVRGEKYAKDTSRNIHADAGLLRKWLEKTQHRFDLPVAGNIPDAVKEAVYNDPSYSIYRRGLINRKIGKLDNGVVT